MPKNLANLSVSALNDIEYLQLLQEILAICLEEIGNPTDKTLTRVEILIDLYLPHAQCRLEDLEFTLKEITNQIARFGDVRLETLPQCPNGCQSPFHSTTVIGHRSSTGIDEFWCASCKFQWRNLDMNQQQVIAELLAMSQADTRAYDDENRSPFLETNRAKTKELGQRLWEMGGMALMQLALSRIPKQDQAELECAWDCIGDWRF